MRNGMRGAGLAVVAMAITACSDVTGPSGGITLGTVWNRYGSANGYQTDVAFGGIAGQPENRVYMCELPGSPNAGLYKGLLSDDGKVITWDAVHGLPEYNVDMRGGDEMGFLIFLGGDRLAAGDYREGSWTDHCNLTVGADGQLIDVTRYLVITRAASYGYNPTSVRVENQSFTLHPAGTPCTAQYARVVPMPALENGNLRVTVTYTGYDLMGYPTSGSSTSGFQYYSLAPGCTRVTLYYGECGATVFCMGNDEPFGPFVSSRPTVTTTARRSAVR